MADQRTRITKRTVDAVPVPVAGRNRLWDSDVKGFCLLVYPTGRRVYALKYRAGSRQRWYTIGPHGSPWNPDLAREEADKALRRVKDGEDPATEKKAEREAVTVAGLIDAYLTEGPATKLSKRASTWAIDRSNLDRHIRPLLGSKTANAVTKADAAKAIADITAGKTAKNEKSENARGRIHVKGGAGTARRTRITAAAMFAWGIEEGHVKVNPFALVRLTAPPVKERFLSRDEAGKLLDALASLEQSRAINKTVGDAIRLLLLTGSRKTEILGLMWSEVDFGRKMLTLPPERTKAGGKTGERRITLSPGALEILDLRRPDEWKPEDYVFPSTRGAGHIVDVRSALVKLCEAAGLSKLRVHDLRHSFASFAVAGGASIFLVSKLLGHASSRTAERYAHLGADPLEDAVKLIEDRVMFRRSVHGGEPGQVGDVVDLLRA